VRARISETARISDVPPSAIAEAVADRALIAAADPISDGPASAISDDPVSAISDDPVSAISDDPVSAISDDLAVAIPISDDPRHRGGAKSVVTDAVSHRCDASGDNPNRRRPAAV
jgi:hypothetical protein